MATAVNVIFLKAMTPMSAINAPQAIKNQTRPTEFDENRSETPLHEQPQPIHAITDTMTRFSTFTSSLLPGIAC